MDQRQEERKKFWCDVYIAYVNSSNSTNSSYAVTWADKALNEFDKKFPDSGVDYEPKSKEF